MIATDQELNNQFLYPTAKPKGKEALTQINKPFKIWNENMDRNSYTKFSSSTCI